MSKIKGQKVKMDSSDRNNGLKHGNTLNTALEEKTLKQAEESEVLNAAFAELQSFDADMGNQSSKITKITKVSEEQKSHVNVNDEGDDEVDMSINVELGNNNFSDAEDDRTPVAVTGGESQGLIMNMDNKQIEPKVLFSPTEPMRRTSSPSQVRSPALSAQRTVPTSTSSPIVGTSPVMTTTTVPTTGNTAIDNLRKRKMSENSPYKITKRQAIVGLDDLIVKLDNMIIASEKRQGDKMEKLMAEKQEHLLKEVKLENAKVVKKMKEESAKTVKAVEALKNTLQVQEQKLQKLESNFATLQKKQNQEAVKTHGGVGILVRNDVFIDYNVSVCVNDYEGLIAVDVVNSQPGFSSVIACTYLAPGDSPYGADPEGYFNRLLLMIYECHDSENIIMCGDLNARIGNRKDVASTVSDINDRLVIDMVVNSHGKDFIEFLNDSCCCVVNGCKGAAKNTFVSTKGCSAIDYVYVPYDVLPNVENFEIVSCNEIVTEMQLEKVMSARTKLPDHCMLTFEFKVVVYM